MVQVQWKKQTDQDGPRAYREEKFLLFSTKGILLAKYVKEILTTSSTKVKKIQLKLCRKAQAQERTRFPTCGPVEGFPNGERTESTVIIIPYYEN